MQCFTRAAMQWAAAHDLDSGPRCVDFYPVWTAARLVREQANFLHDALSLAFVFSPTGGDVPIPTLQQLPRPVKGVIGAGGIADQLLTPIDVFISSLEHMTRR
jgi:hypothetical protein